MSVTDFQPDEIRAAQCRLVSDTLKFMSGRKVDSYRGWDIFFWGSSVSPCQNDLKLNVVVKLKAESPGYTTLTSSFPYELSYERVYAGQLDSWLSDIIEKASYAFREEISAAEKKELARKDKLAANAQLMALIEKNAKQKAEEYASQVAKEVDKMLGGGLGLDYGEIAKRAIEADRQRREIELAKERAKAELLLNYQDWVNNLQAQIVATQNNPILVRRVPASPGPKPVESAPGLTSPSKRRIIAIEE